MIVRLLSLAKEVARFIEILFSLMQFSLMLVLLRYFQFFSILYYCEQYLVSFKFYVIVLSIKYHARLYVACQYVAIVVFLS